MSGFLLHGQLSSVFFPNLVNVTIGNPTLHSDQAIATFSLLALFAALPTVKTLKGYGVEHRAHSGGQYSSGNLRSTDSKSNATTLELHAPLVHAEALGICLQALSMLQTLVYRVPPEPDYSNFERMLHILPGRKTISNISRS